MEFNAHGNEPVIVPFSQDLDNQIVEVAIAVPDCESLRYTDSQWTERSRAYRQRCSQYL